tara:strand:- start:4843 stop:5667 length:825 start_codon:yes stop_codon:yes gene_type:complete
VVPTQGRTREGAIKIHLDVFEVRLLELCPDRPTEDIRVEALEYLERAEEESVALWVKLRSAGPDLPFMEDVRRSHMLAIQAREVVIAELIAEIESEYGVLESEILEEAEPGSESRGSRHSWVPSADSPADSELDDANEPCELAEDGPNLFVGVLRYSNHRLARLAGEVANRMRSLDPVGLHEDFSPRDLWDEYCYEVQEGPTDPQITWGWGYHIRGEVLAVIEALDSEEAVLLSLANPEAEQEAGLDLEFLQGRVTELLSSLAGESCLEGLISR